MEQNGRFHQWGHAGWQQQFTDNNVSLSKSHNNGALSIVWLWVYLRVAVVVWGNIKYISLAEIQQHEERDKTKRENLIKNVFFFVVHHNKIFSPTFLSSSVSSTCTYRYKPGCNLVVMLPLFCQVVLSCCSNRSCGVMATPCPGLSQRIFSWLQAIFFLSALLSMGNDKIFYRYYIFDLDFGVLATYTYDDNGSGYAGRCAVDNINTTKNWRKNKRQCDAGKLRWALNCLP